MNKFIDSILNIISQMQHNLHFVLGFIGILWGIYIINRLLGFRLNLLGIYPRSIWGLPGIFCAPFLHANFNHLFFNSIPLFVLSSLVLLYGKTTFYLVSASIIILSGIATWILGRKALHVGASSLIMGYFGYLVAKAYLQPSAITVIMGIVAIYYFGGLFFAIIPSSEKHISWEAVKKAGPLAPLTGTHFYTVQQCSFLAFAEPT